jgi:NAD(P)-dependent dehydrogenase (short-subunit alcohol dehydrogenase family)
VDDIAPAVLFLAGPGAAHITGTSLAVDGGQLLV